MNLLREYIRTLLREQPDLGDELFGVDEEDTEYEKDLFSFFEDHKALVGWLARWKALVHLLNQVPWKEVKS